MLVSDKLYLGRYAEDLSDLIERQSAEVFRQTGLLVPVKSCSLLAAVCAHGPATISDLAQVLGRSHQLVRQKLPKLIKLKLINRTSSSDDKRLVLIAITDYGRRQLDLLEGLRPEIERAYTQLESEVGPVTEIVRNACDRLNRRSLIDRIGQE